MIEIRALATIPEFEEAVRLQKEIWGFEDIELLPRRLFVVANKVGGQTFGVFDGGRMVAFLISIPGLKPDGTHYLHSHMLGTLAAYQNRGLGRLLKLKQREDALARGIRLAEWTFDPLEIKNAYFNLERLGAVVRRFVPNQYGTTSSHLHGGLPTDRCVAEWWLDTPRVEAIVAGKPLPRPRIKARIAVPSDIARMRDSAPRQARTIQDSVRERFLAHFRNGLEVIGFENTPEAGTYLLAPREEQKA
ncbi:MAG: acetyltransferase [Acidobacteria bacterium]|nr:acetyltransferase [Acidobacteriota bacterium]